MGLESSELVQDFNPIDIGHEDVKKHEIHALAPDHAERRSAVPDIQDRVVVVEDQAKGLTYTVIVVDDEQNRASP